MPRAASGSEPVVVFVHVQYFADLVGGVYTVAIPKKPGSTEFVGESHAVERWASGSEAQAWAYACIQAVLAATEAGYRPSEILVRGDRADLGRLLKIDWDGQLGLAVMRYRFYFGAGVRFQYRAGDRFRAEEIETYRRILLADRAEDAIRAEASDAIPGVHMDNARVLGG